MEKFTYTLGDRKSSRQSVTLEIVGAVPIGSVYFGSIALLVEQTAVNRWVESSNLSIPA